MAARATRSPSGRASASGSSDDASRCLLLALSHDELGVIVDGLADPLQPVVAVALSSTCLGLRTPLRAALKVLQERHARAKALCRKVKTSCTKMRDLVRVPTTLAGTIYLTTDDMATLGMILRTNGLPRLLSLFLATTFIGDAAVQALCEGLGRGAAPLLRVLDMHNNNIGPAGAAAFAAALRRGALPKLALLSLSWNPIGSQGVAALAAQLRRLPELMTLLLVDNGIGDEGVASLFANLGKDDFKAFQHLWLTDNQITDAGMATLVAALDAGRLPRLLNDQVIDKTLFVQRNRASASAVQAVEDALANRSQ